MTQIDFRLQVLHTQIQVCYSDIARLDADALVSSDDVYVSMGRGVSAAIRAAAGDAPREDARKHELPLAIGQVLVTSAGQLRAKYILHAITIDFHTHPDPETLVPQLVRRVMELAAILGLHSLALPLVGAGFAGLSERQVFELMIRSIACYLATENCALRAIMIAVYASKATDHAAAEQTLLEELAPVGDQIRQWSGAMQPLNARLALLQPLLPTVTDDVALHRAIEARIAEDRRMLCRTLACGEPSAPVASTVALTPLANQQDYEQARSRLLVLLNDLHEEIAHREELQRAERRRLRPLERQRALKGDDTDPQVLNEIEDIARNLEQRERQVQQLKEQHEAASRDLAQLQRRSV